MLPSSRPVMLSPRPTGVSARGRLIVGECGVRRREATHPEGGDGGVPVEAAIGVPWLMNLVKSSRCRKFRC
jgi:hypothetical protein